MPYTRFALWLLLLLGLASCVTPPEYPEEPVILYEGVNKTSILQRVTGIADSLTITLSYTDGDGDLSLVGEGTDISIFDSRFPNDTVPFTLPEIPIEGTGNGISGDIMLRIVNGPQRLCCIAQINPNRPPELCIMDERFPVDTFRYLIQLRDRAGNVSNVIRTEQLQLLCLEP